MAGSFQEAIDLYSGGKSIPEVSCATGMALSTVRYHVKKAGVLRSRAAGVKMAGAKIGAALKGRQRTFSADHCAAIKVARIAWGEKNAAGTSLKPNGYIEFTRGPHKGRSVHVVKMEERIGRRLRADEVVHHIDHDRSNNDIDNLALMTRAAHARLHRLEEQFMKKAA